MKRLEKILAILGAVMTIWMTLSFVEVGIKNKAPNPQYSKANLLVQIFDGR